jgi:hypothetical protein
MEWRHALRPIALAASLPMIALAALAAWRSVERFYMAYLFKHRRLFSEDLAVGHIKVRQEIEVWCFVLGTAFVAFLLLRFWSRRTALNE